MSEQRRLERLAERKAKRGPTKEEILTAQGKKYVTFVVPIEPFNLWAAGIHERGSRPNDRIWELIVKDMKGQIDG